MGQDRTPHAIRYFRTPDSAITDLYKDLFRLSQPSFLMSATNFPPFPDDIPTHALLIFDYELIKARDVAEIGRLWEAATKLGFW